MALEIDPKQIKSFSPINSLNPENAQDLIKKISATEIQGGHYVFKKGDMDKTHTYLLKGALELVDEKKVIKVIKAGSPESLQPIAHAFPRPLSARAQIGSYGIGRSPYLALLLRTLSCAVYVPAAP